MIKVVRKRDGREQKFQLQKIVDSLVRAMIDCSPTNQSSIKEAQDLAEEIVSRLDQEAQIRSQDIYDTILAVMIEKNLYGIIGSFIEYRDERDKGRDSDSKLMKSIAKIAQETVRDNANIGNGPSAKMLQIGSEASRWYNLSQMPKHIAKAHTDGDIHIHDLDYFEKTVNCIPEFENILIRNARGETSWVKMNYLDQFFQDHDRPKAKDAQGIEYETIKVDGLQVYGRTGWTKLQKVMRRRIGTAESLYKFKARKGLPLHATALHKIPVIRDGEESLLYAKDILPGDKLLASRNDYDEEYELPILDLFVDNIDKLPNGLSIHNADKLIHWLHYRYSDFQFKRTVGCKQSAKGFDILDAVEYKKIADSYLIPYEVKMELSICLTKGMKTLPAYLAITPELMRLIGYTLAEGHIRMSGDRTIMIANQDPEILKDIKHCINIVFNDDPTACYKDTAHTIQNGWKLNGSVFVSLFAEILGMKTDGSASANIPDFAMSTTSGLKAHFLQALIDGDGAYTGKEVHYTTVSKLLAEKLVLLLNSMGISSSLYETADKGKKYVFKEQTGIRNFDSYAVRIIDTASLQVFFNQVTTIKNSDSVKDYAFTTPSRNLDKADIMKIDQIQDYNGYVYDLETAEHWFMVNGYIVHNCLQIPLGKLLTDGFNAGRGFIRPPKRIGSAAALAAIILQSNQNDMYGGQSFSHFEEDMAPFVPANYDDYIRILAKPYVNDEIYQELIPKISAIEDEVFQAMEGLVYNLNSMHSRAGAQVPFSSINFGLGTTSSERLIIKQLLLAYEAGLGHGETPLFPNLIFRIKDGINKKPGDPNYDLKQLACRVSSKRMNPTFSNMDMSINAQWNGDVAYMGCRTRVQANINGPQVSTGRGNIAFVTMNLVRPAIDSGGDFKKFYRRVDKLLNLCEEQLLDRYATACRLKGKDVSFLIGQHLYVNSEKIGPCDSIEPAICNGTLSIGFIGVAEAMKLLTDHHHGESQESWAEAYALIEYISAKTKEMTIRHHLNFTTIATPAEGLSGRFIALDRKKYGIIEGITDKGYYTNSFHVPVDYTISIIDKMKLEGPFHKFCDAGHISYIELKESPHMNPQAVEDIVDMTFAQDVGYMGINFPIDECPQCHKTGIISGDCECGYPDGLIRRIRRVTGYLSTIDHFGEGKIAELEARTTYD